MIRLLLFFAVLAVMSGCETGPRQVLPYIVAGEAGQLDLYLYDLEASTSLALAQTRGVDEFDPVADYHGQRIAYVARQRGAGDGDYALRVHDLQTGQTEDIVRTQSALSTPVWSNNGKKLAYGVQREGKLLIEVRDLTADKPAQSIGFGSAPSWRVDDRAIFYNSRDTLEAPSGNLMVHDLKTGLNQSLALRGNGFRNLSRGTSIVYTTLPYSRRNEAIWVIDINSRQTRLSSPGKTYRDLYPVHINGTKFVAFTRTEVETNKSSIFVVERYAEDPVETMLFEAEGNASTSGAERLADQ